MLIIQKPGAAVVTEFLAAFIEFLMGNMGGPLVLISGLVQGLGAEAGFAVLRYRRFNTAALCFSGIMAALFSFAWGFVQNAYALISTEMLILMLLVRIISAVIFAGIIGNVAAKGLARTGVLKSYALGSQIKTGQVVADERSDSSDSEKKEA